MSRAYYGASISTFLLTEESKIIGDLTKAHGQELQHSQTIAWAEQIRLLHFVFRDIEINGDIFFEFMIPRMGRRSDVIIITGGMIFVLEFKVGANNYSFTDRMQTMGYALDLKHFHEGSHNKYLVPILICTNAPDQNATLKFNSELVADVLCCSGANLAILINQAINQLPLSSIDIDSWLAASYKPTPTIIEAAQALYSNHNVVDITRSEAGSINIAETSTRLFEIIHNARLNRQKVVCFVTGVPGAGKTLVGLNIANQHATPKDDEYSVFLSGNGPLVAVLQEALSNDLYKNESVKKVDVGQKKLTKQECRKRVESFIQNIHRFRDNYLMDQAKPPEHVAIFDEAQRAWNQHQAEKFMKQKRGLANFNMSEPEFLISVMDRHDDWAVIIALVGGGQEINVGEVGILGWFDAMNNMFKHWHVYCSPNLLTGEYVREGIEQSTLQSFHQEQSLHLAISMRSFRAEKLSSFVHFLIAGNTKAAAQVYKQIKSLFPIVATRNLDQAKAWLKLRTIANRRCGLLASSNAIRLKAEGIFVKNTIEPEKWFLVSADDIRSSCFLEDVATEFDVQGLELDWSLIAWDADFRFINGMFQHWRFSGTKWQRRLQNEQQRYLENAYRVLLTRAREGMVIFVPEGDENDSTRLPAFYCETYQYLLDCGLNEI